MFNSVDNFHTNTRNRHCVFQQCVMSFYFSSAGNTEVRMSLEEKYAKGNKYVVTVSPSSSPNRRFLVIIVAAVAVVALVVLLSTLIPIYATGKGKPDTSNGMKALTLRWVFYLTIFNHLICRSISACGCMAVTSSFGFCF